jgi:Na+/H+ antiporter
MRQAELFVVLLVPVVLAALAVRRLERVPDAVALVVGGLVAGLLPFAPDLHPSPDLILVGFLPPILYPSAFTFASEDVRANIRPITLLAVGLVAATMAAIAVVLHLAGAISWAPAFAIGAVLAPTDPVAATGVIRSVGAPARLATILEGESLINDGIALTGLKIAVVAAGGSVSLGGSVGKFALVALGGAGLGAALGFLTSRLRRRLDFLELEATIGILLAYAAFILAERLGLSGVLWVVLAGYVMGRSEGVSSPATRLGSESFWSVVRFLGESILFLLVGIAFAELVTQRHAVEAGRLAGLTAAAVAAALGTRLLWMLIVPRREVSRGERAILASSGLRGAVSVAAALSIPATSGGQAFPARTLLVAVAIASIIVLLVGPALALPAVLRHVDVETEDPHEQERRLRDELSRAALAAVDDDADEMPDVARGYVRGRYEQRPLPDAHRELLRRAVEAQRRRLAELRREGEVHGELLRRLERDIDIDQLRLD